uniref:Uncharacterized protein n=1 Tax=viral metagenome TaxID=1070528 RepID=A0A6M3JTK8_9ZZZZ
MAKLQKSGYGRIWPMKQNMGKTKDGSFLYREVYLDVVSKEIHFEVNKNGEYLGWKGNPPNGLAEQPILSSSDKFRRNYEQIRWEK